MKKGIIEYLQTLQTHLALLGPQHGETRQSETVNIPDFILRLPLFAFFAELDSARLKKASTPHIDHRSSILQSDDKLLEQSEQDLVR